MPSASHSAALAWPTAAATAHPMIFGYSASRCSRVSSFESRTRRIRFGAGPITTAPTLTGPAHAPRPTSSMPHTSRAPSSKQPCSTRSLGACGRRALRATPFRRPETLTADAMDAARYQAAPPLMISSS